MVTIGQIKWFNLGKGIGFIESAYGDIFFHIGLLTRQQILNLKPKQEVVFKSIGTPKGPRVIDIISIT